MDKLKETGKWWRTVESEKAEIDTQHDRNKEHSSQNEHWTHAFRRSVAAHSDRRDCPYRFVFLEIGKTKRVSCPVFGN
jgi:hypothetical protein